MSLSQSIEIFTLSLHDALPICYVPFDPNPFRKKKAPCDSATLATFIGPATLARTVQAPALPTVARVALSQTLRSEEHTSELQSLRHIVCRLLLEKKKTTQYITH